MIERRMLRERRFPPALVPVLAGLKVTPRPHSYCVVSIAAGEQLPKAFAGRRLSIAWGDEAQSFIVPEREWPAGAAGEVEKGFRVLSLSPIPPGFEGNFMAVVAGMLADALVNACPCWSPGRVELLVKSNELKTAREALDLIVHRAKGRHRAS